MATHKFHHSSTPTPLPNGMRDSLHVHHQHLHARRSVSTNGRIPAHSARLMTSVEGDLGAEEDPKVSIFKELYHKSESRLASLFENPSRDALGDQTQPAIEHPDQDVITRGSPAHGEPPAKKTKRTIDEDDYDDSDGEDEEASVNESPLKGKSSGPALALTSTPMFRALSSSSTPATSMKGTSSLEGGKTTEAARKKLEEDKKATEEAAKRSFLTLFYTLENDRDAMLEQKRLEESERQVEVELGHGSGAANADSSAQNPGQTGTLSQTNLGASSLTLKNLIKRIDDQRIKVKANDTELRALISEVRKNRSKWASEEKVGQEELYEAAEKVLNELKAMTEHSGPFLTKVGKKDAPDYHLTIKHPMDLGSMTKKLKGTQYKSKQEFVDDLNLIWANCLKFNADPNHFLRRHALFMRKETEKLVPLIPNIVIRDRAEVEAEERRLHANLEGEEDSDDEPIMSSRGRKAPGKKSKKGTVARKAPAGEEGSPDSEVKPPATSSGLNALGSHIKRDPSRGESEHAGERHATDPPGTLTPAGVNGVLTHGAAGNQSDSMDVDGESMVNGVLPSTDMDHESENDDEEYKTWKQVTKKDRALITAERHRLFKGESLDPEATALLRTKAGMRRWIRQQKEAVTGGTAVNKDAETEATKADQVTPTGETLAEGMEGDEERVVPDYYDPLAAIPDIPARLRWVEDSEGKVQDHSEEFLRILPKGLFIAPESQLATKICDNLHEIQKTQKLTAKIGVVKQMQLQSQMYQGQFQKHEIIPFVEQDIQPHVMLDDGPVVAPNVCRAALQRTVAKLLVHAGFDETQPAAIDAITDMAGDYFTKVARTLNGYSQAPPVAVLAASEPSGVEWKQRFSVEEAILHSLQENGADLEALDSYVTEDIERTGTRLSKTHDSMKSHLAELLRPALTDAGPDGSNAFNDDSEQFVGGDFAEELGEDFFGFKELGLDAEFGGASLSVPLHLLKSRMYNANQTQNASTTSSSLPSALPPPAPFTPITVTSVKNQIGLVQQFFLDKLSKNHDNPLVEDDDLPQKQRFPKPRLPPTGKITSPRKRPVKEPGPGKGHPKKKMKLNDGEAKEVVADSSKLVNGNKDNEPIKEAEKGSSSDKKGTAESGKPLTNGIAPSPKPLSQQVGKEKIGMATPKSKEKLVNGEAGGMISPESLEANGT